MQLTKGQFNKCNEIFINLGEHALYKNHYQLAQETEITNPLIWREFLMDPRTTDYVNTEMSIIRNAAINEMVQNAPKSNSVGQSQLLNALQKLDEKSEHKDGPIFIYTYVPLNDEQKEAPNIRRIHADAVTQNEDGSWNLNI